MACLPGTVGWPLLGDKSLEFYRDPVKFVEKNCTENNSRIFCCRFLNNPTVFVCSNDGVREVLANQDLELGYKPFMGKIFGDNILFTDGDEAYMFRDALAHLFTSEAIDSYQDIVRRVTQQHVNALNPKKLVCLYQFFKEVVTEICLTLFLGLDFSEDEEATTVVSHTLKHWHGIVSVPVKLKIPGTCSESAFCAAMMAKKSLLKKIETQRCMCPEGFVRRMQEMASEEEDTFVNNHLLLFTSALIPKALSSLLTSFAIEAAHPDLAPLQEDLLTNADLRSCVFKEVQRMFPPFLGGRRVAKKNTEICGYKIPADHAVIYMTYAAHRDPETFVDPDVFRYKRWSSTNSEEHLFTFGYGPRGCIGQKVVWNILNEVVTQLLTQYHWRLKDNQELTHKLLPVTRPKGSVFVKLIPTTSAAGSGAVTSSSSSSNVSLLSEDSDVNSHSAFNSDDPGNTSGNSSAAAITLDSALLADSKDVSALSPGSVPSASDASAAS